MADKLNIPGFKHYELDSTYQAKLAAGEVDAKDLSFVKETGKLYTQGGVYGGGGVEARILQIPAAEGASLTEDQIAYNLETYNKIMSGGKLAVYVDPDGSTDGSLIPLTMDASIHPTQVVFYSISLFSRESIYVIQVHLANTGEVGIFPYEINRTIDTELSDTSVNAVQNKVVTAAINGIDTRVQEIEDFFDEGAKLNLTIKSNQGTDSTISAVKAIIEYDGQSVQAGSGVIGLPVFTDIKITFPDVEGYKTPAPLEFTTGALPVVYEVTYETELVNVTVTAWDGTSVVGQIITINGTQYTWNGTTIQHKVPFGTEYKVSGNSKDGYIEPEETFTASLATRNVTALYSAMVGSWITLNQTITDPATMISGDVNGEHIQLIRNNSHRYLGKYTADGTMTVCQLDDTDSNLYADGSAATLTGEEGDVFMKLPKFYYVAKEKQTDVWSIGFYYGDSAPSSAWKEWDGNDLIGVYKIYVLDSKAYSRSGVYPSTNSYAPVAFRRYITARGSGFSMVKWKHHCMMAFLFYAMYGNMNSQAVIGTGAHKQGVTTGGTDAFGMEDTVASVNSINFWGLENWWGDADEYIDNVVATNRLFTITEDDGTERAVTVPFMTDYMSKAIIGEDLDLLPSVNTAASATTGYCDQVKTSISSTPIEITRGYYDWYAAGGIACIITSTQTNCTRLCFRGNIIINNDSTAFKALTAIG